MDECCESCPLKQFKASTETAPEINLGAAYLFVGEAPGKSEVRKKPFIGASGKLLRKMLSRLGLEPGSYSIINAVRCVNLKKPTPPMKAIHSCQYFFWKDFKKANPKFVIALGAKAWSALHDKQQGKIDKVRGKILTCSKPA